MGLASAQVRSGSRDGQRSSHRSRLTGHIVRVMQVISLGPLTLNAYTFLITGAALGSLGVGWWQSRDARLPPAALIIASFALLFARAGYVILNWAYFREHVAEIATRDGLTGLSEHAAILGVVCGLTCVRNVSSVAFKPSFVLLACVFIAVAASLGCIPNGCAYGREVFWQTDGPASLAWRVRADWPDAYGLNNPRWPVQGLLAAWLVLAGIGVWLWVRTNRPSKSPWLALVLMLMSFAAGDFVLQYLRGDPALMFASLRVYQWLDLGLIALLAPLAVMLMTTQSHFRRKV